MAMTVDTVHSLSCLVIALDIDGVQTLRTEFVNEDVFTFAQIVLQLTLVLLTWDFHYIFNCHTIWVDFKSAIYFNFSFDAQNKCVLHFYKGFF